jgi:hypothetical protein
VTWCFISRPTSRNDSVGAHREQTELGFFEDVGNDFSGRLTPLHLLSVCIYMMHLHTSTY